ncbi:MAG: hypothetical protein JWP78_2749 [Mucilaginibacter sp.]|nr:hypothetical protein [Mucilaginibacter sp.]
MKKIFYIVIPVAIILAGCGAMIQTTVYQPGQQQAYADNYDTPTDQVFYDELGPYGTWVDYPDYGYVWVPDAGGDFRPYASNGYWVYSDYGWTWVSNYSWGWAPFHYGRWFYDDYYGWMWMPGHEWAPAWVTWGSYGDNYCWAPIGPGVNASAAFSGGWNPPAYSWNVVPGRHITRVNVANYIERNNATVINNITIINNVNNYNANNGRPNGNAVNNNRVTYNRGPQINDVENVTRSRIQPVKVTNNTRPGAQSISGNQLSLYRPAIQPNSAQSNNRPAPKKVEAFRPGNNPDRLNQNQQIRPGQSQNPYPRSNYPQNARPDVNQRPNVPQQNPQNARPDVNQNPNVPPQNPQNARPDVNQNPNQRSNVPQQNPQNARPDINQNPGQNQNQRPDNQNRQPGFNPNAPQNQRRNNKMKQDTGHKGRRPVSVIKS